jgi:hypothetical protein
MKTYKILAYYDCSALRSLGVQYLPRTLMENNYADCADEILPESEFYTDEMQYLVKEYFGRMDNPERFEVHCYNTFAGLYQAIDSSVTHVLIDWGAMDFNPFSPGRNRFIRGIERAVQEHPNITFVVMSNMRGSTDEAKDTEVGNEPNFLVSEPGEYFGLMNSLFEET